MVGEALIYAIGRCKKFEIDSLLTKRNAPYIFLIESSIVSVYGGNGFLCTRLLTTVTVEFRGFGNVSIGVRINGQVISASANKLQ